MLQYLFDTLRIINAGYDLYPTTALVTLINLYGEDSLQSLRPRHRIGFVLTRLHDLFRFILQLSWHDMRSQLAPRGENPMKPREVHPRLWDQSRQTPDKLHGAEDGV